jgi:hypothetical protein
MPDDPHLAIATLAIFLFAGFIKGIVGLGLPVLAIGLLSLVMPPAQAVALLTVPSIVTNVWQLAVGPHLAALVKRLWVFLLANFVATLAGLWTGFLTADTRGYALAAVVPRSYSAACSGSAPCIFPCPGRPSAGCRR